MLLFIDSLCSASAFGILPPTVTITGADEESTTCDEVVVEVGISCLIRCVLSLNKSSVFLFSGITGDVGGVELVDNKRFFVMTHLSHSSVAGTNDMRLGHALHVVHSVSINCAKLSSSLIRNCDGIFT